MTATEQARADAVADAETWLANLPPERLAIVKLAREYTEVARLWMLQGIDEHDDRQAYSRARWAARLLFRAMPELRGEP